MAGFIVRQPNGLLCRFSTIVDCPTNYNMTDDDYIELCKKKAENEARDVLKNYLRPFPELREHFEPNNMSRKEFNRILKEMERPADGCRAVCT